MTNEVFDRQFLRQFSLLSLAVTLFSLPNFLAQSEWLSSAVWLPPISFLPWAISETTYWLLFCLVLLSFTVSAVSRLRLSALLLPTAWLLILALEFSFGKIDHTKHAFFFVSLAYLLGHRLNGASKRLPLLIAGAVGGYAASGLWKIRGLFQEANFWQSASENLPFQLAYSIAEGSSNQKELLNQLQAHDHLSALVWLSVILLQVGVPFLAVAYSLRIPWILTPLLIFHFGTWYLMGIKFIPQMALLIWLIFFINTLNSTINHYLEKPKS